MSWLATVLLMITGAGCERSPQVSFENLKYIAAIRTACSAQDAAMLENVKSVVEKDRLQGAISEQEWNSYQTIIGIAEGGDWKAGERACHEFQAAQFAK